MSKILIVDDNSNELILMKRFLRKHCLNVEVQTSSNGQEAIDYLAKCNLVDLPKFVILDLKMPKVGGLQVLDWIRKNDNTKFLPVVIFSCSDERSDVTNSYESGANSYVQKRVDQNKEFELLSNFWLNINQTIAE